MNCLKRTFIALLLIGAAAGLFGCSGSGRGEAQSQSVETSPTQKEVAAAYQTAADAYDWFTLTTMPLDSGDTKRDGDVVYNRVVQPGIGSMAELKAYLDGLFTPDLTEGLLKESADHYRDFNGVLYAQSADRGTDIHLQGKRVTAVQRDAAHWDVTITFYAGFTDNSIPNAPQVTVGYSQTVLDYEKTDAGWRFATFCTSDQLDENAETVYTFSYDNDILNTDFEKYDDFKLCCYLLNADGAFSEGPMDLLAHRFLKAPERVMKALILVEESPWEHKNLLISGIGYEAVSFSAYNDRTEFEALLKNHAAPQSDTEGIVWDLISDAYQKGSAAEESQTVKPEQEFSLCPFGGEPEHDTLQLGVQEGEFPWGFPLDGTPKAQEGGDTYGQAYEVICKNALTLRYTETDDGQQHLYSMTTEDSSPATSLWTRRGARCGDSEADLKTFYPDELIYLDVDHVGPSYGTLGVQYDGAWAYEPGGSAGCKHILFFMKDGTVAAMEVADLMDARLLDR